MSCIPALYLNASLLEPRGQPVAAGIRRRHVTFHTRVAHTPDELAGAEVLVVVVDHSDLVPAFDEPLHRARVELRLDVDRQAFVVAPARRVARRLRLLL